MFKFNQAFDVYVDGTHVPDVTALQLTLDTNSEKVEHNKVSLYHIRNGKQRIMTVELEAVSFVTT